MDPFTPGKRTSEFNLTLVTNLVNALIALLVGYGLLTAELSGLWQMFLLAAIALIVPVVSSSAVKEYVRARTALKIETLGVALAEEDSETAK